MTAIKNYYEILGVARNASADLIKIAFRRMAMKLHPDVNKAIDAEAQFKLLNEAYQVLGDPVLREEYDEALQPEPVRGPRATPQTTTRVRPTAKSKQTTTFNQSHFNDFYT
ncbi:unnamed protein product [Didymodactylos carnosus]|uniref:DnaJ homolog subfamily B member 9 n=1 Tax=Didymodactylos carnosus TaxID=1234261 RepID=A0A8S2CX12_9BILA|nr:unnamed protein product [Didymodactylos carnosus]CAF3609417.1 unnamed protein product [Didymodactylos carnosus]